MADLESDIIGQVARLPLRPSEENALLPLYEAVSNALHAINDRFGDEGIGKNGKIYIEVFRSDESSEDENAVVGFSVSDNGVGLDEDNFKSFCTPFSQHKLKRGGKGIGRLGWLKVFEKIRVRSVYVEASEQRQRNFDFILREKNQISLLPDSKDTSKDCGTKIALSGFIGAYGSRCPVGTETICQRLIGHFLPVFAAEKSPSIFLTDGDQYLDLKDVFKSKIIHSEEKIIDIEIDGEIQPIIVRHMRCDKSIRPRNGKNNWLCFCANDRGVKEYCIDDQIGLKLLDGEEIYVGTITGDYLDDNVNTQRTDFIFDPEDGKLIRRQIAASVKEFLSNYVEEVLLQKKRIADDIIRKNPQYIYIKSEIDEFVSNLKPNSLNEEAIYVEMSQNRYRRQRKFVGVKKDIEKAPNFDEAISTKVAEYQKYIIDDQKGSLAEYVIKRKAVLDLLDTLRGFSDMESEKQHLEEAVHKLICPMRIDSNSLEIEDHNLWVLDDRLAFFRFFASDRPIKQFMDVESGREPDIAFFYDSCIAWRESDRACDTVIIVEFKRPGLESYSDKNDPLMQLMDYVSLFKSGSTVRDKKGNVISGIGHKTAFQCYIVADITDGLKKRLRGHFDSTPDGKGLFGYTRNPDSYVEVIPYDKLLTDAQERNAIFFEKLGLNG